MKYFDSHAHYYDERFSEELEQGVDTLIDTLFSEKVSYIINVGTDPTTSRAAAAQARKYENMYTAIGIHPSDTRFLSDMDSELAFVRELIRSPESKCVALGEIGLDYHYDFSPRDIQKVWFKAQLELARQLDLPAVIHDRDAHGDVFDMIKSTKGVRCVMHSCSESAEAVRQLTDMGHYISFSGSVTFKNAKNTVLSAEACPLDKILIETDCPYLAPTPHRGKLNHSGLVRHTAEKLADNYWMSLILENKFIPAGLEVMIAFLAAHEYEVKNLRIVLSGKEAGIATATIRERIRDSYV